MTRQGAVGELLLRTSQPQKPGSEDPIHQAKLKSTPAGLLPDDDGWFILNLRDIGWETIPGNGTWCAFECPDARSERLGIGVHVLLPGEAPGFYHAENEQEGFLVLSGECVAVVEGEERRMGRWDYLHCPPGTAHITVGAGSEPCALLMVGTRSSDHAIRYLVDQTAAGHGFSVEQETSSPEEAYARRAPRQVTGAPPPFV